MILLCVLLFLFFFQLGGCQLWVEQYCSERVCGSGSSSPSSRGSHNVYPFDFPCLLLFRLIVIFVLSFFLCARGKYYFWVERYRKERRLGLLSSPLLLSRLRQPFALEVCLQHVSESLVCDATFVCFLFGFFGLLSFPLDIGTFRSLLLSFVCCFFYSLIGTFTFGGFHWHSRFDSRSCHFGFGLLLSLISLSDFVLCKFVGSKVC